MSIPDQEPPWGEISQAVARIERMLRGIKEPEENDDDQHRG